MPRCPLYRRYRGQADIEVALGRLGFFFFNAAYHWGAFMGRAPRSAAEAAPVNAASDPAIGHRLGDIESSG